MILSKSSHSRGSWAAAFVRQLPGEVNAPMASTFASRSAQRVLWLIHVHYMCAHRTLSFAAREAHAKRARSRCAAASTGQAPTPCTRTRQLQRGRSFPCKRHAPWLHVTPMECMGSMKRDLAFWSTSRSRYGVPEKNSSERQNLRSDALNTPGSGAE